MNLVVTVYVKHNYANPHAFVIAMVLLLVGFSPDVSSADQLRRGADGGDGGRRRGVEQDRSTRRPIEGGDAVSQQELERKQKMKVITDLVPPRCGVRRAPKFRRTLLALQNPTERFNIELWGNERTYYVLDPIYYFLRSNREAYVTMFWIGPEGSVFIPFTNLKIEANRNHKIDPKNIIVEPVGRERWRVIATPEPHLLPCTGDGEAFSIALRAIKSSGTWAAASWDVVSKVRRGRRRLRFRDW